MDVIQLRRDTAANWRAVNPILREGEPGYETDTKLRKIGDGVTAWNDLDYLSAENITQEFGNSPNLVISQASITRALEAIGNDIESVTKELVTVNEEGIGISRIDKLEDNLNTTNSNLTNTNTNLSNLSNKVNNIVVDEYGDNANKAISQRQVTNLEERVTETENTLDNIIVQELGNSKEVAVSQKVVTEAITNIDYTYISTANTATEPKSITTNSKVFYIATEEGDYTNFGVGKITEMSVIKSVNGSWIKEELGNDLQHKAMIENHKNIENSRLFPNVFNPKGILTDTFLDLNNGTTYKRSNYSTSDFIPVLPNEEYVFFRTSVSVVFYDINLRYVSYIQLSEVDRTIVPDNVYYVRISYYTSWASDISKIYVGKASELDNIDRPIVNKIADKAITTNKIADKAITTELIMDETISIDKIDFRVKGKNLCNQDSPDFIAGYYLASNGKLMSSATAFITPFIPLTQDMGSLIVSSNGNAVIGGYVHCVYDKDFNFINSYSCNDGAVMWKDGIAYVRFSGKNNGNVQVEVGTEITPYEPYYTFIDTKYIDTETIKNVTKEDVENNVIIPHIRLTYPSQSFVGQDGISIESSLNAGEVLTIGEYPKYLKKTGTISTYISWEGSFSGIVDVGFFGTPSEVGNQSTYGSRGVYLSIDNTNLKIKMRDTVSATLEHNLTIDTFLVVAYKRDTDGTVHIILTTRGGVYKYSKFINSLSIETYGRPSIYASALNLLVKLSVYNEDFRKPIWVVGDSYVSLYDVRWVYQLQEMMGIKNWLLLGLAGGGSSGMLEDLQRALTFGTPKYLIWCLGMNDSDNTWLDCLNQLKELCQDKGIELILATVPTVPGRSKEVITQAVRNSGYRYIDFYKALGATPDGTWLDDRYLEEKENPLDRVHTTELGAKIQAARVLVDFPEIIKFG